MGALTGLIWLKKNGRWLAHVNAVLNLWFHKMQKISCLAENCWFFKNDSAAWSLFVCLLG